ncbi:MAG: hypothetical protein WBM17_09960 [Anaerolineales bacterium]
MKTDIRLVGWLPVAGSALAIAITFVLSIISWRTEGASPSYPRWVIYIIPLVTGLQAAFVLSPSDEHSLEILLASPCSMTRILLERLGVLGFLHGSLGFIATVICLVFPDTDNLWNILIGWLAPGICLAGIALWITQSTHQSAYSALMTMTLWGATILGGDAMIKRWPVLWPFHLFLRPEEVSPITFVMNRIVLILAGLALLARATQYLKDEEHMLGIHSVTRKR